MSGRAGALNGENRRPNPEAPANSPRGGLCLLGRDEAGSTLWADGASSHRARVVLSLPEDRVRPVIPVSQRPPPRTPQSSLTSGASSRGANDTYNTTVDNVQRLGVASGYKFRRWSDVRFRHGPDPASRTWPPLLGDSGEARWHRIFSSCRVISTVRPYPFFGTNSTRSPCAPE